MLSQVEWKGHNRRVGRAFWPCRRETTLIRTLGGRSLGCLVPCYRMSADETLRNQGGGLFPDRQRPQAGRQPETRCGHGRKQAAFELGSKKGGLGMNANRTYPSQWRSASLGCFLGAERAGAARTPPVKASIGLLAIRLAARNRSPVGGRTLRFLWGPELLLSPLSISYANVR